MPKYFSSISDAFNNPNRIYGLDILRALAIIFVVYQHGRRLMPKLIVEKLNPFLLFDGVSIFFVLSGFLIGTILIKNFENYRNNKNILFNFWLRRWFRTIPLYIFILIIHIVGSSKTFYEAKYYFIFSQNINYYDISFFGVSWSLSVEEWFYLVVPLIIFLILKIFTFKIKTIIPIVALVVIILGWYFSYQQFQAFKIKNWTQAATYIRNTVLGSIHLIMYGIIAAWLKNYFTKFWNLLWWRLMLFIVVLIVLSLVHYNIDVNFQKYIVRRDFIAWLTFLSFPFFEKIRNGKGLIFKIVTFISLTSYSIYLVHQIVNYTIIPNIPFDNLPIHILAIVFIRYSCYIIITLLISYLTYNLIELPFIKLRDRKPFKNLFPITANENTVDR